MQASQIPVKFQIPFANAAGGGFIRQVPVASQIGIQGGAASLTDGFPPLTFLPVGSGGVPPFGQDVNGILNQITAWLQWNNAGGMVKWDSTFSTAIGGYPVGSFILNAAGTGFWLCTVDNNATNPDAAGAGWLAIVVTASNALPLVDGSGAAGTAVPYSRGDHRHPTDTSRLAASYLSSDTGKVAGVVAPGFIVVGHVPKFSDNQGTIADGYATSANSGKVGMVSGTHTVGGLLKAGDVNGSAVPGPSPSSGDAVVASVHGAAVIGNLPQFNDVAGTVVDSGFSPAGLMGSSDALKYQLRIVF